MQPQIANAEKHTKPRPAITETPTLYSLARKTLRETGNDADEAETVLFDRLSEDKALMRSLISAAVKSAIGSSVAVVLSTQRAAAYNSIGAIERGKAGVKALANGIASALLDMPLADGTRLRDATKIEIAEAADLYEKRASTYSHRARFLRAVSDALPAGKKCGAVLTEAKARQIYQKAA